jgi:hypothetical protein
MKMLEFYSMWALLLHFAYYFGVVPNTYTVAIFVLFVSQFFGWIYPGYYFIYPRRHLPNLLWGDLLAHYLPCFMITPSDDTRVLILSFVIYNLWAGPQKVYIMYKNPLEYVSDPNKTTLQIMYDMWVT